MVRFHSVIEPGVRPGIEDVYRTNTWLVSDRRIPLGFVEKQYVTKHLKTGLGLVEAWVPVTIVGRRGDALQTRRMAVDALLRLTPKQRVSKYFQFNYPDSWLRIKW